MSVTIDNGVSFCGFYDSHGTAFQCDEHFFAQENPIGLTEKVWKGEALVDQLKNKNKTRIGTNQQSALFKSSPLHVVQPRASITGFTHGNKRFLWVIEKFPIVNLKPRCKI